MRDPRSAARHWILEIHLVTPDGAFGGFYERLLDADGMTLKATPEVQVLSGGNEIRSATIDLAFSLG